MQAGEEQRRGLHLPSWGEALIPAGQRLSVQSVGQRSTCALVGSLLLSSVRTAGNSLVPQDELWWDRDSCVLGTLGGGTHIYISQEGILATWGKWFSQTKEDKLLTQTASMFH